MRKKWDTKKNIYFHSFTWNLHNGQVGLFWNHLSISSEWNLWKQGSTRILSPILKSSVQIAHVSDSFDPMYTQFRVSICFIFGVSAIRSILGVCAIRAILGVLATLANCKANFSSLLICANLTLHSWRAFLCNFNVIASSPILAAFFCRGPFTNNVEILALGPLI